MVWMMITAMADPGAFAGTWVFSGGQAERAKLEEVVESGAQRFNFAIRAIARGKIRKACALDETIAVTDEDGKIMMAYTGANPRKAGGPNGQTVKVGDSDVIYKVDGKVLTVDGKSDDGSKLATYKLTGDDTMKATVEIASSSLGDPPLVYTLSYKRQ